MNQEFEQSFSDLAYASLQERNPDLMDKVVGFQLISSNDEHTKALGMFAMLLGEKHTYVPVFFIAGKIKPLELMYLRDEDKFVPLDSKWVDWLSKGDLNYMGVPETLPAMGLSQPNLEIFATPPRTGRVVQSAFTKEISDDIFLAIEKMAMIASPKGEPNDRLIEFLINAPSMTKKAFLEALKDNRSLLSKIAGAYGWKNIELACSVPGPEIFKEAAQGMLEKAASDKVKYIFKEAATSEAEMDAVLDDDMSKAVIERGYAVQDGRPITSHVYYTEGFSDFTNPAENKIYKVIDAMGNVRSMLVAPQYKCLNPKAVKYPSTAPQDTHQKGWRQYSHKSHDKAIEMVPSGDYSPNQIPGDAVVIDLESGFCDVADKKKIFCSHHEREAPVLKRVFDAAHPITQGQVGQSYVMLYRHARDLIVTDPFRINEVNRDEAGSLKYNIRMQNDYSCPDIQVYVSDKDGAGIRRLHDTIVVTQGVMLLPVKYGCGKLRLGNTHALAACLEDSGLHQIKMTCDKGDVAVSTVKETMDKYSSLKYLVEDLGVYGPQACKILKDAEDRGMTSFWVKKADMTSGTATPMQQPQYLQAPYGRMGPTVPTPYGPQEQWYYESYNNVAPNADREGFRAGIGTNLPGDMFAKQREASIQMALEAAQTGSPEVFNAGIIGTLAEISDVGELMREYLPDLDRALDRLGRMIFLYWWKYDSFKDQYSLDELAQTEDNLRNLFKKLGEVILRFKSKGSTLANLTIPHEQ